MTVYLQTITGPTITGHSARCGPKRTALDWRHATGTEPGCAWNEGLGVGVRGRRTRSTHLSAGVPSMPRRPHADALTFTWCVHVRRMPRTVSAHELLRFWSHATDSSARVGKRRSESQPACASNTRAVPPGLLATHVRLPQAMRTPSSETGSRGDRFRPGTGRHRQTPLAVHHTENASSSGRAREARNCTACLWVAVRSTYWQRRPV